MSVAVIIPARLAATRLPDKPLALIAGRPMIQHVAERAARARSVFRVLIATPDAAIFDAVTAFGGAAVMTSDAHRSGTDRVAEAASHLPAEFDIIVNVQGDEPLVDPTTIDAAVAALREGDAVMATVSCPLPDGRESDPNVVKVVCDKNGYAMYFSRSPLPFRRDTTAPYAPRQHVGLYAYRRDFLARFPQMEPTPLELSESLEQLRVLENGYRIRVVETATAPESVDTPDDLARVRVLFSTAIGRDS
ncbi:MAG: 3-deoxy-manno-octulosonate cytidylyltransferase [Armatimonadetes bacterium]|nr:3-deoxy-manno-octulosonate cytidylyltransferase [Armatimonadota bacterium]